MNKQTLETRLSNLLSDRFILDPYEIATAVFDAVGRYTHQEDLGDFTLNEVESMMENREVVFDILKDTFGVELAKKVYGNWIDGNHDT